MHASRNDDGGLGCLILFLLGAFIWALVHTWPWPLLLPSVVALSVLVMRRPFRDKVRASFKNEDVEPKIAIFRKRLAWTLLIVGAVLAVACAFTFGFGDIQWWLVVVVPWTLAFRLCALSPIPGKWSGLAKASCDNATELLLIASIVLAFYALFLWPLQAIPLNTMTLATLQHWDRRIFDTHECLEAHKPNLYILLDVQAIIVILRIVAAVRPSLDLRDLETSWGSRLDRGTKEPWTRSRCCSPAR